MTQYTTFAAGAIAQANSLAAFGNTQLPFINVKLFQNAAGAWTGALGTNDADDDEAIQAAITVATNATYPGTIYFPPGIYKVSTQMVLADCHIICSPQAEFRPAAADTNILSLGANSSLNGGWFNCRESAYSGTVFTIVESSLSGITYSTQAPVLKNVVAHGYANATGSGTGILFYTNTANYRITFVTIDNIMLCGFTDAIKMNATGTLTYINGNIINNIRLSSNYRNIFLDNDSSAVNGNIFTNITVQPTNSLSATQSVFDLDDAEGNIFTNIRVADGSNCDTYIIDCDDGSGTNVFLGTGFETASLIRDASKKGNIIQGFTPVSMNNKTQGYRVFNVEWLINSGSSIPDTAEYSSGAIAVALDLALGDFVLVGCPFDMQDCLVQGYVMSTTGIAVRVWNETGDAVTFADTGIFKVMVIPRRMATHSVVYDFDNISANSQETHDFTVTGAELGDFVLVGCSTALTGLYMSAQVTAPNTVSVTLRDLSVGDTTLGESTFYFLLIKAASTPHYLYPIADMDSIASGAGVTKSIPMVDAAVGDFSLVSYDIKIDDMLLSSYVYANYVDVRVQNETATDPINHEALNMRVKIIRAGDPFP